MCFQLWPYDSTASMRFWSLVKSAAQGSKDFDGILINVIFNVTDWKGERETQFAHFFLGPIGSIQSRIQAMAPSFRALWFPTDEHLGQLRKTTQCRE